MGHYANEISDEGLSQERVREIIENNKRSLKARWENGLEMSQAYPFSSHEYSCPQCFAKVESNFLAYHDEWHRKIKVESILGPGLL